MATPIPFDLVAEYRGQKHAREYTDRESGEVREALPRLKFEYDVPGMDAVQMVVKIDQLDRVASTDLDVSKLKKGDFVRLVGSAVVGEAFSEESSYISLQHVERAKEGAKVAPIAVAS
jgi:hypothetical protein